MFVLLTELLCGSLLGETLCYNFFSLHREGSRVSQSFFKNIQIKILIY